MSLFFELYGVVCFLSLVCFLILAVVAKHRPDLDEEDYPEIEKLRKLVNPEPGDEPLLRNDANEAAELLFPRPAARSGEHIKRLTRRRPHAFHVRKPRLT